MENANVSMKLTNERRIKNANANGMKIESFCVGNVLLLVCCLSFFCFLFLFQIFLNLFIPAFIFDLFKSFILANLFISAFTFHLFKSFILDFTFSATYTFQFLFLLLFSFVCTNFLLSFSLSLLFLKNGSPHEEKSCVSRLVVRFGPLLCLIKMYVATVLVTNPMMGSFLSFFQGVSEALENFLCQLGVLTKNFCHFVPQNLVSVVCPLNIIEEQVLDGYGVLGW